MAPMVGTEMGAAGIAAKTLWWEKQEHYGLAGEELRSMLGKYLFVPLRAVSVLPPKLMKTSAFRGSCPRPNLDER